MAEKITNNSQLHFATLFNVDSVNFWDLPGYPTIIPQDDDLTHTVSSDEVARVDLIAYDYYGDSELWWVIMLANSKQDMSAFSMGEQITIPAPRYVTELIGDRKRGD